MNDSEKIKMTLNIGGQPIKVSVDIDQQSAVRKAEKATSDLFSKWQQSWPSLSDQTVMAMVAYQFALYYQDILDRYETAATASADIDARLQALINDDRQN